MVYRFLITIILIIAASAEYYIADWIRNDTPDTLPQGLKDLYNYNAKYTFDQHGSITFHPMPPETINQSTFKLPQQTLTETTLFRNILESTCEDPFGSCKQLVEAINNNGQSIVIDREYGTMSGFVSAALKAWVNHYPFKFKPDHIWLLILQKVARHVERNAEQLRYKWVNHQGKLELIVNRDGFIKGSNQNDWASVVEEFVEQIDNYTINDALTLLNNDFTSSTLTDTIAIKTTIMDIVRSYFGYTTRTTCGFHQITLEGNRNDWVKLRNKAEMLLNTKVMPDFGRDWAKSLLPLLDKFVDTFDGKIDCLFWNSMIKKGAFVVGSGGYSFITGWINIFFQRWDIERYNIENGYVMQGLKTEYYDHFEENIGGIEPLDYPIGVSSAPIKWEYYNKIFDMKFVSGFMGYTQNEDTLEITPNVGWFMMEQQVVKEEI